jgi:plastocyanin
LRRTLSLLLMLAASLPLAAVDRWILISGTVGAFHTDVRVFNPSFEKDIVIGARFLPGGNPPVDNNRDTPTATFTVPKRSQHILNDVTSALFNSSSLGAIVFTSEDPFEVTSRIYAQTPNGTLGQFGPGLSPAVARPKGAIVQMKSNGVAGQVGTFRTNIGVVNPANANTTITWRLYDKNNALVTSHEMTMPPFGVTTPIAMADAFFWGSSQAGADLSDSWVSFTASNPIFAYASVLDNGTTDQTFIAALEDVGVAPAQQPPTPTTHTFDVRLEDFSITFSPAPTGIKIGDTVRLRIQRVEGTHGFQMTGPTFTNVVPNTIPSGSSIIERTFVASAPGTYSYFCTVTTCGAGHNSMAGDFQVGDDDGPGSGPGY